MPDGKKRSYTTILTVLQLLEGKELVTHTSEGRAHVYRAAVTRKQVLGPLLRNLVGRIFGGSATEAVQALLNENDVSDAEILEIQDVLARARSKAKRQ
jgi:predicted transcriptional regulator